MGSLKAWRCDKVYTLVLEFQVVDNVLGFIAAFWRFMTRVLASIRLYIYFAGYTFLIASGGV